MEEAKFCPLIKNDCKKGQCAWWDIYTNECVVLSMMLALWADVYEDEDDDDDDEEDREIEAEDKEDNAEDEGFADGDIKEFKVKIKSLN